MPTYNFENTKTGEQFEEMMSISAKEAYLAKNKHIIQIHTTAPGLAQAERVGRGKKIDNGFKEVLSKIKQAHPLGKGINV